MAFNTVKLYMISSRLKQKKNTGMVHPFLSVTAIETCIYLYSKYHVGTRQMKHFKSVHQQRTAFLLPIIPFSGALPERPQSAQEIRSSGQPVFFEPPRQKSQ